MALFFTQLLNGIQTLAGCGWLGQQRADNSFFLYLAYNAVHTPLQAPEKLSM